MCWRVSCYFPGITLALLTVLNMLIWHTGSSGAIPLGAFFSLIGLWFIISIPLCYSGALLRTAPLDCTTCLRRAARRRREGAGRRPSRKGRRPLRVPGCRYRAGCFLLLARYAR